MVNTYEGFIEDGKVILETVNTALDFTVHDADDAVEQYSVLKEVLTSRGLILEDHIIIGHGKHVSCEEGSLGKLLQVDCNDIRVIGDDLTLSMDRGVLRTLKDLTGETVIDFTEIDDILTDQQKDRIHGHFAFDIDIMNHGEEITQFDGYFTVWFDYEAEEGKSEPKVYFVRPNGSVEQMPTTYENGIVTFKTNHLSIYYVSQDNEEGGSESNNLLPIIIISVIAAAVLVTALVMRKKMKKRRCQQ